MLPLVQPGPLEIQTITTHRLLPWFPHRDRAKACSLYSRKYGLYTVVFLKDVSVSCELGLPLSYSMHNSLALSRIYCCTCRRVKQFYLIMYSVHHQLIFYKSSAVAEMRDRLATIDVGRKVGRGCCGGWVPTGSPSNTVWPGPRPTSLPSGILIHPTVWPPL